MYSSLDCTDLHETQCMYCMHADIQLCMYLITAMALLRQQPFNGAPATEIQ